MTTKSVSKDRLSMPDEPLPTAGDYANSAIEAALLQYGPDTVRELVHGLRTIRYGSIVLTLHEGQLVEITKTVRIRPLSQNEKR
jgi:hypothetical protein